MNTPEAIAVVELNSGSHALDYHWENLMTYGKQGNLQAVFDEYAYLLASGRDRDQDLVTLLHTQMVDFLNIHTVSYTVDTFKRFKQRILHNKDIHDEDSKQVKLRTHFAVAFTQDDTKESDTQRKKNIRNAFNTPFRPFVLATTSIGQEGLDFHNYCRKIVHWNLPHNPIDLEQREGRINRFQCLAIRQNVAKRYGAITFNEDIWQEMFAKASQKEKLPGSSDLIPYWGLRATEDMVKIERIVPMYPYSKDIWDYERLIKILSMYRTPLAKHAKKNS